MSGTSARATARAPMLTGELVMLRPLRTADLPTLYDVMRDPATWLSASDKPLWLMPFSAFEEMYAQRSADQEVEFAIEAAGVLVGRCALFEFDDLSRNATLGITLGEAHRGKGYGRDAVGVLLDYGFSKRNLHRVQLDVLAINEAGLRTYLSCGFVDLVVLSVLRSEWLDSRQGQ